MSIITWLKTFIYGPSSDEPLEQTNLADEKQHEVINQGNMSVTTEPEIKRSELDQKRAQEKVILGCIQGSFRIINESIEIARRSKNLETKLSRLDLAKKNLEEAQKMANAYQLHVEGFANATAEIKRIEQALESEEPTLTDDMPHIGVASAFATDARKLLMEATALKNQGQYLEACDKLKQAYRSDGSKDLFIEERIRLPMYLLLAGREEEGIAFLNQLERRFDDPISQAVISKQRTIFQKKANKDKQQDFKTKKEPARIEKTVIKTNNHTSKAWKGNQDIVKGLEFIATLHLRTPLRTLTRHGEAHTDINKEPPAIASEDWEGCWVPKIKSLEEILGHKFNEPPAGLHSSEIGPISPSEYIPFLIAIRKIVELEEPMQNRIDKLRVMLITCEWQNYVEKHGGIEMIVQKLFPRTIRTMPKLNDEVKRELANIGIESLQQLSLASDKQLLSIKGIGPVKLKAIREHCEDMAKGRDAERVDAIIR